VWGEGGCGCTQETPDTSVPTVEPKAASTVVQSSQTAMPAQTVGGMQMNQECTIRFLPRKVFGQWLLRKAAIEIGGNTYKTKIKKPIEFTVQAGSHNVLAYGAYLDQSCKAQMIYNFEPGKQYLIRYKTRVLVFLKGKIKIEEFPAGTTFPKK